MRYTPRPSVTAAKVLPVASSTAVTVTPGSTPPVESVTVPVNVASCAYATTGSSKIPQARSSRPTILNVMTSPDALTRLWAPSLYTNFVYSLTSAESLVFHRKVCCEREKACFDGDAGLFRYRSTGGADKDLHAAANSETW